MTNGERRQIDPDLLKAMRTEVKAGFKEALGELVAHDLMTKEGREALRSDFYHLHNARMGAEAMKRQIKSAAIKTAWGAATLTFLAGVFAVFKDHIK